MSFRYEMFKYQLIQAAADKIDKGNSELFSNQFYRGRQNLEGS
jgi:hypothetical protein